MTCVCFGCGGVGGWLWSEGGVVLCLCVCCESGFLQITQIQTCLPVVVRPGLVSTSPAFMRSIASHPVGPQGRLAQKKR